MPQPIAGPVALKANPGEWRRVSVASSYNAAATLASSIRNGRRAACWQPRGSFEAYWEKDSGEYVVFARYVGGGAR